MIKTRTNKKRLKRRIEETAEGQSDEKTNGTVATTFSFNLFTFRRSCLFDTCVLVKVYDIHDEKDPLNVADVNVTPPYKS